MRRNGWRTPVPSHKSFCLRTGDPGFTSRVDGWALSWGFFCSSAFGLVCAAAGDWSLELRPGGRVWLNAVDAKNQRKKAQCRVIRPPALPKWLARGWPFAGNTGGNPRILLIVLSGSLTVKDEVGNGSSGARKVGRKRSSGRRKSTLERALRVNIGSRKHPASCYPPPNSPWASSPRAARTLWPRAP
jgi:hypothetical protein